MNAYLINVRESTFGQTEAGCHAAISETLIAEVAFDATEEEITAFMEKASPQLSFRLGNQREAGDRWGEMFPLVEVPIAPTREGLLTAMKIATKRRPDDPCLKTAGQTRLVFGENPPELHSSTHLDAENLAYQRDLLS